MSQELDPQLERTEYLQTRREYTEGELASSRSYDKTLVTLASSSLGLSVVLWKQLPNPELGSVLLASWVALASSLTMTLLSMHLSAAAFREQRDRPDEWYTTGDDASMTAPNPNDERVELLNRLSLWSFVLGVLLVLVFAGYNLSSGEI